MKEFEDGKFKEWSGGELEFDEEKWESMHQQLKDFNHESWKESSFLRIFFDELLPC